MFSTKRLLIGGAITAGLLVSLFIVLNGQGQANRQGERTINDVPFGRAAKDIDDAARPIVDYERGDRRQVDEDKSRKLKNARYDKYGSVKAEPHPETGEVIWDSEWSSAISDLPADKSDLVVEGIVADSNAFLSEDKTGVYSEFAIRVSSAIKVGSGLSVNLGDMIVAERFGGRVRYPSGQIVLHRIGGQGFPISGKKYVFFLTKADHDNYKLLTAYEVLGQKVYALDGSRINFRGKGNSKFDKHNGEDLGAFMAKLTSALNESREK